MDAAVIFLASPEVWARGHGPHHPLKPERLERTYRLLEAYEALEHPELAVVAPRQPSENELRLFHTEEYIQAVRALSQGHADVDPSRYNFGPGDNPVFEGMFVSEGRKVGSALQAAEAVHSGECSVAFSYSGGLHHGGPDFASGFCVFNDVAVALTWLVRQGRRPLYVDIDVHHGDGVQAAFYESDSVMTISLHQDPRTLFPGTGFTHETGSGEGEGHSANLPLPPYTDDSTYRGAFDQVVPPLLGRFEPDILVTQLGVDTHFRDPLAQLALTTRGHTYLFEYFAGLNLPWLALGGGGYDLSVVPRSWTLAVGAMLEFEFPEALPKAYRQSYGGTELRDDSLPESPPAASDRIRRAVDESLEDLKSRLDLQ